jgi:hypothetical protein
VSSQLGVSATWAQVAGKWTDVVFRRIPLPAFDTLQLPQAACRRKRLRLAVSVATPEQLRDAKVYVNGKRRRTLAPAALGSPFTVRAATRRRRNRVSVVVTTAAGTELRASRKLGRCPKKSKTTTRTRRRR